MLVFDRLLARIVEVRRDTVVLKGGLVLELRLGRARTTKDIDLRWDGAADDVLAELQRAGQLDLGDFMRFEIEPDQDHPQIQNDGMAYDGLRFRAECRLAGKVYGGRFGIDVAFGDRMFGEPTVMTADDVLAFADIPPPQLRLYPVETHIAEKLHAYTMPRGAVNSRIKDLPDIALLARSAPLDAVALRAALEQTFKHRGTHELPMALPEPPVEWTDAYARMAARDGLAWAHLPDVAEHVRAFLDPVLNGPLDARWDRVMWCWMSGSGRDD
jgi:hypothetical protein